MIKFSRIASERHRKVLLCASVAILLAACGAASSDQAERTAQTEPAALKVGALAPPGQAAVSDTDGTAGSSAPLGDVTEPGATASFDLRGYDTSPTDNALPGLASVSAEDAALERQFDKGGRAAALALYVAPNGSDGQKVTGSKADPFRTIWRASRVAKPGTVVYVAPGDYRGGFQTKVSGKPGAPISFVSTERWKARIISAAASPNPVAWDNRGDYIRIVGFEVDGRDFRQGRPWRYGIYQGGSYGLIRGNHVHHIAQNIKCTSDGGSAIGVDSYFNGVKSDVIANYVHDMGPAGCHFVQGIYMSTSGTVKNNVVFRISEAAIHLWHDAHDLVIANNTVAGSNTGIIIGGGGYYKTKGPANHVAVLSNIVFDNRYGISEQGQTGDDNTYGNNLVYNNRTYDFQLHRKKRHEGTVSAAPDFVHYDRNAGLPDFHLRPSSAAIGRASPLHAYPTDYDGKARNAATGFDIGAYQH